VIYLLITVSIIFPIELRSNISQYTPIVYCYIIVFPGLQTRTELYYKTIEPIIQEGVITYLPLYFPLGLRTIAFRLTILSPSSEGSYRPEYNPLYPLPCLLLKPISAHYAHCPIGSAYRLIYISVLSGHIDSITITAIIYYTL
jgi:hypothetical protein